MIDPSSRRVDRYRYRCLDEGVDRAEWRAAAEGPPTRCHASEGHSIDPDSVTIVDSIASSRVVITDHDDDLVAGSYQMRGLVDHFQAAPEAASEAAHSFPFLVKILAASFVATDENVGARVSVSVAPRSPVGALTADAPAGATTFAVTSAAFHHLTVGSEAHLGAGAGASGVGAVVSRDEASLSVTVEEPAPQAFPAGSPVLRTVFLVRDLHVPRAGEYRAGGNKIGGSLLPAGAPLVVSYQAGGGAGGGADPVSLSSYLEILY